MAQDYLYDVRAFAWNSKTRTFSQDAWNLEWIDIDGDPRAFPSMREPFTLKNFETGNERDFIFKEEKDGGLVFENTEDNITCIIWIYPF
jgi:hypothetical protein